MTEKEEKDAELREHLLSEIYTSSKLSDWIYHDVRLDCDDSAKERSAERLKGIHAQYGRDTMFGMTAWWAMKAYWRLERSKKSNGDMRKPDLLPKNVEKIMGNEDPLEVKRAFVSAQQFISSITHNDLFMAHDIFCAVYDTSPEEWVKLMFNVLVLSIRISDYAEHERQT